MSNQDQQSSPSGEDAGEAAGQDAVPGPTVIGAGMHTDGPGGGTTGSGPVRPTMTGTGTTHVGRYRLVGELGQGGFGTVFLAQDDSLNRPVAVKVLKRNTATAEVAQRESGLLALLRHPGIAEVYDVGTDDGGRNFIVTRFVDGEPLSRVLQSGPVAPIQAALWASQIAAALQHAHSRGITHRDIKPSNLMITRDGDAVVLDFGVALLDSDPRSPVDYSGTPAWMSPEQAAGRGSDIDGRSDLFSLGAVLYEMLTGVRAFRGDTAVQTLALIQTARPRPVRQIRPEVSPELEAICQRCLEKQPEDRFATAADLQAALEGILQDISSRPSAYPANRAVMGVTVVTAIVLLLTAVWWFTRDGESVTSTASQSSVAAQHAAILGEMQNILVRMGAADELRKAGLTPAATEIPAGGEPATAVVDPDAPLPLLPAGYAELDAELRKAVDAGDQDAEYSVLLKLSNRLTDELHFAIAEQAARRMLAISEQDDSGWPIACGQLGLALYKQSRFDEAIGWLMKSIGRYQELYDALQNREGERVAEFQGQMARMLGISWMRIGNAHKFARRYEDAGEAYRTAMRLYEKHDRDSEMLTLLLNYGSMESQHGNHLTAITLLTQGLDVAGRLDDDQARAELLVNLANAVSRTGDEQAALSHFSEAEQLAEQLDDYELQSKLLLNTATTLMELGRTGEARAKLLELKRIARPGDNDAAEALELLPLLDAELPTDR